MKDMQPHYHELLRRARAEKERLSPVLSQLKLSDEPNGNFAVLMLGIVALFGLFGAASAEAGGADMRIFLAACSIGVLAAGTHFICVRLAHRRWRQERDDDRAFIERELKPMMLESDETLDLFVALQSVFTRPLTVCFTDAVMACEQRELAVDLLCAIWGEKVVIQAALDSAIKTLEHRCDGDRIRREALVAERVKTGRFAVGELT